MGGYDVDQQTGIIEEPTTAPWDFTQGIILIPQTKKLTFKDTEVRHTYEARE